MLNDDLKGVNLKYFCKEYGLPYNSVWQTLKKYRGMQKPKVVLTLLELSGYSAVEVTAFKFSVNDESTNTPVK